MAKVVSPTNVDICCGVKLSTTRGVFSLPAIDNSLSLCYVVGRNQKIKHMLVTVVNSLKLSEMKKEIKKGPFTQPVLIFDKNGETKVARATIKSNTKNRFDGEVKLEGEIHNISFEL